MPARSKLTPEQREAIAADKRTCLAIAADYGVSGVTVSKIRIDAGTSPGRGNNGKHPRRKRAAPPAKKPLPDRHYRPSW